MKNITKIYKNKQALVGLIAVLSLVVSLANIATVQAKSVDANLLSLFVPFDQNNISAFNQNKTAGAPVKQQEKVVIDYEAMRAEQAARLDAYFAKRDMPLEGYGKKFVEVAEKYDIDWRLLPAIGVRESSGGKHLMNNNPFGWGSAKIKFDDFGDAIEAVAYNLGGANPNTSAYYKDTTTYKKLWYYNGTVMPTYPDEVIGIMNMF